MMMNYPNYPAAVMPVAGTGDQSGISPFGAGTPGPFGKGAGLAQQGAFAKYGKPLAPSFGGAPGASPFGAPSFGAFGQPDLTPYSKPGWRAE